MGALTPEMGDPAMSDTTPDAVPTPDPAPDPVTPEQLPPDHPLVKAYAATKEQLKDAKRVAAANTEAAQRLAEIEAANQTQAEKDAAALADAQKRAAKAEEDLARLNVATSKGLPPELAARLVGDTVEAMAEDADRLLALMTPAAPPAPTGSADGGPQGTPKSGQLTRADLQNMTPEQIVEAKAAGRLDALLGVS
jgi:hypothetical protein